MYICVRVCVFVLSYANQNELEIIPDKTEYTISCFLSLMEMEMNKYHKCTGLKLRSKRGLNVIHALIMYLERANEKKNEIREISGRKCKIRQIQWATTKKNRINGRSARWWAEKRLKKTHTHNKARYIGSERSARPSERERALATNGNIKGKLKSARKYGSTGLQIE